MISLRRLSELSPQAKERAKRLMLEELDETLPAWPRLNPVPDPTAGDLGFTEPQLDELLRRAIRDHADQGEALWQALRAALEMAEPPTDATATGAGVAPSPRET